MKSKAERSIERITGIKYKLVLEGAFIGVLAGIVVSVFRQLLVAAEIYRGEVIAAAKENTGIAALALLALFVCYLGAWACLKVEPMCGGSGIPQVLGELKGRIFQNWWKVILAKVVGATLSIGAGLSLGREGPSIQLGAMAGKGFSAIPDRLATEEKLLITCGAAAGLSAAFSAPLAGAVFALEGLQKNFSTDILLGSMASSISANFMAYYFFGLSPVFELTMARPLPLRMYWALLLLGLLLGLFGVFYVRITAFCQDMYDHISSMAGRLAIPFLLVIPLAVWYPAALGGGYRLVTDVAEHQYLLGALAVLLVMKFCFSVLSFGSGAPGGIFMPLLVIGGISGGLFFQFLYEMMDLDINYIDNFVVYGMVGYFAAIVRSPVTGVILITEMVGDFNNFMSLSIVALIAFITADALGSIPIYTQLLKRMLAKAGDIDYGMTERLDQNKVILNSDVYVSSRMDGVPVREMGLPQDSLIVAVLRDGGEIVPDGATRLQGGDVLNVLCKQGDMEKVDRVLDYKCRTVINKEQ